MEIVYTVYVSNLFEKIKDIESKLYTHFNIKFIAYDQTELKITFNEELTDDKEMLLMSIIFS